MEIVTTRLLLRDFTPDDALAFAAYHSDPRSAEFYTPDQSKSKPAGELLQEFMAEAGQQPRRNYHFAIATRYEPSIVLGCCGLRQEGFDTGIAEFGIELAPDCWGHGYAYEAAGALLSFGFETLGLSEIRGVSVSTNARIAQLVRRLGFSATAVRPGSAWMQERDWRYVDWQLTQEAWQDR